MLARSAISVLILNVSNSATVKLLSTASFSIILLRSSMSMAPDGVLPPSFFLIAKPIPSASERPVYAAAARPALLPLLAGRQGCRKFNRSRPGAVKAYIKPSSTAERIPRRGKSVKIVQVSTKFLANLLPVAPFAALIRLCFDLISFARNAISSSGKGPTPAAI